MVSSVEPRTHRRKRTETFNVTKEDPLISPDPSKEIQEVLERVTSLPVGSDDFSALIDRLTAKIRRDDFAGQFDSFVGGNLVPMFELFSANRPFLIGIEDYQVGLLAGRDAPLYGVESQ